MELTQAKQNDVSGQLLDIKKEIDATIEEVKRLKKREQEAKNREEEYKRAVSQLKNELLQAKGISTTNNKSSEPPTKRLKFDDETER